MNPKSIVKARSRLRVSQRQVDAMSNCRTYEDFSDLWSVFLHAAKGIYTSLELRSKSNAYSRQWFGGKNRVRKSDQLLRYITEARNDDEHGIEPITEYVPAVAVLGIGDGGGSRHVVDEYGNTFINCGAAYRFEGFIDPSSLPRLKSLDGKPVINRVDPAYVRLTPVRDRSGIAYPPPTTHLGEDLPDRMPATVARLAVRYLEGLVAEAESMSKGKP